MPDKPPERVWLLRYEDNNEMSMAWHDGKEPLNIIRPYHTIEYILASQVAPPKQLGESCFCGTQSHEHGFGPRCIGWAAPPADFITFPALIAVLERLRSKHKTPNDWYEGWNAAIDCLLRDANAASTPVSQPAEKNI